jgi:hypothetical protein
MEIQTPEVCTLEYVRVEVTRIDEDAPLELLGQVLRILEPLAATGQAALLGIPAGSSQMPINPKIVRPGTGCFSRTSNS